MGLASAIEWTNCTWNPWQGCTKVSPACDHCYMFRDMRIYGRDPTIVVRSKPPTFNLPLRKHGKGPLAGEHKIRSGWRCFTCSWSDWFHQSADPWRAEAWAIVKARPDVTFQIVTKRTERIPECLPADWGQGYRNVWLIATAENQELLDKRAPELLAVPAACHGLSIEPLLGPINARKYLGLECLETAGPPWVKWVIVGGENAPAGQARAMRAAWVRDIRDQCGESRTAFFFKQWGTWLPFDQCKWAGVKLSIEDAMNHAASGAPVPVGKKAAGRVLDGREWSEFPSLA